MQNKYKFGDIFTPISVAIKDAKESSYDKFVGLEHYDSLDPVISRYTDTSLLSSSVKEFHVGDMLVARRNVYLRRAGVALFNGLTSGDSIVLRIKSENDLPESVKRDTLTRILPFVLNSENFWIYANKHADGMNSKRISIDNLLNYEFNLPSIDEQKVLAEKLWAAYEVKQSYLKMIDATDGMVKAQFNEMFGKYEANHSWSDVLTITNGKAYPGEYQESGTYPICGSAGIMSYGDLKMCNKDTIILGRKGNINSPIYMDQEYWIVDTAFCLDVNKDILNPMYFYYWCCQYDFTKLNKQGVLPSLTRTDLENVMMAVPPLNFQDEFASIVYHADKSKAELRKSIDAIDKVIKSLINENL